jgi:hypothetical protein
MKRKILIFIAFLAAIFQSSYLHISAQSYYMHEAAEDSDGSSGSGIVALLILIGIGTLLTKMFGKDNDSD